MRKAKQKAYFKGLWAERLAAFLLMAKGYRIEAMRYKTRYGEIDIIARRGNVLAFIEVKAYSTREKGVYAISDKAKGRIMRSAQFFLGQNPQWSGMTLRFDAMIMHHLVLVAHLLNAWNENDCYFGKNH